MGREWWAVVGGLWSGVGRGSCSRGIGGGGRDWRGMEVG